MKLSEYYFRVRENGAMVFRVNTENRMRRIDLDQIAVVNIKNGEIKPHGDSTLSEADHAEITRWLEARRAQLEARVLDDILRTVDHLNLTAMWAQRQAKPEELEAVSDALLMAMHDLRTVLVRKKSESLGEEESD